MFRIKKIGSLIDEMGLKNILLLVVLCVPCLIWDLFFTSVELLYKGCCWINKKGDIILLKITE